MFRDSRFSDSEVPQSSWGVEHCIHAAVHIPTVLPFSLPSRFALLYTLLRWRRLGSGWTVPARSTTIQPLTHSSRFIPHSCKPLGIVVCLDCAICYNYMRNYILCGIPLTVRLTALSSTMETLIAVCPSMATRFLVTFALSSLLVILRLSLVIRCDLSYKNTGVDFWSWLPREGRMEGLVCGWPGLVHGCMC